MNEREIFSQALKKSDPEERSAFLDEVCGQETPQRHRIEQLLNELPNLSDYLEHPAIEAVATELVTGAVEERQSAGTDTLPDMETQNLEFLDPSDNPDALGTLGQYEIMEIIGRGGMGIVLRGIDPKLNRVVAIKVLSPDFAANPTAHKRFLREAQAAAAVSHDHIVTIHAVEENPIPHLVMEFIDGKSLQQKINEEGQLEVKEVLRIARQIASGLAAAHEQGLTHRDIKPSNILLKNGIQRVQITDFGLARATADADITRTGEIAGTPQYMSPEQAKSEAVDPRSDLFSLGSVMYAMCCGHSPFRAETSYGSIKRVCEDEPRSIRENNPEIPTWLEEIIFKLLEKNPDDRFQSAEEVVELLGKHLSHLQDPGATAFPGLLPAVKKTSPPRPSSTRRHAMATVAVVLLALLTLGFTEAVGVTHMTSTVIRLTMGEGTLVIEVDDPSVEVSIDGEELSITGAGLQELKLRPGQYQFQATKDGKPLKTELVSISRNGRQVVHVAHETRTSRSEEFTKNEWIDRAFELAEEGKWGEASAAWDRSLKAPRQGERHPYGYALYPIVMNLKAEDYPRAEKLLSQNYEACYKDGTNPNWARITLFLGQLSPRPSMPDQTFLDWYRKNMIEKEPQEFAEGCSLSYGLLLYRQGKYEEALKYLPTNSLPTLQELSVSILFRSMAYAQLGKLDEARSSYREAEQVQTLNVPARDSLDDIGKRSKPLWYAWAIYDIAHEQARDLLTERGIDLSDLNPPPAAGVSLTPFIVLSGNGQEVARFSSLNEAVFGSSAGDSIEIHGNGPFVVRPLKLPYQHPLSIRAGEGFHPVILANSAIRLGREVPLLDARSSLALEGLELRADPSTPCRLDARLVTAHEELSMVNCRLVMGCAGYCVDSLDGSGDVDIRNCELLISDSRNGVIHMAALGRQINIANSLLIGTLVLDIQGDVEDSALTLTHNSIAGHGIIGLGIDRTIIDSAVAQQLIPLKVNLSDNVALTGTSLAVRVHQHGEDITEFDGLEELLPSVLTWKEQRNLYEIRHGFLIMFGNWTPEGEFPQQLRIAALEDWNRLWGIGETGSIYDEIHFQGRVNPENNANLTALTPDDFRLRPESAGYQAGPNGKDLGANIDFVGPGEAYERWKQTDDYRQWLLQTAELIGEATAKAREPFVILSGDNQEVARFQSLNNAVLGSSAGDTIEIRGDGPFETSGIHVDHPLTIRAGTGCQPVIRHTSPNSQGHDSTLVFANRFIALEGLQLESFVPNEPKGNLIRAQDAIRLLNCRIVDRRGAGAGCLHVKGNAILKNCEFIQPGFGGTVGGEYGPESLLENNLFVGPVHIFENGGEAGSIAFKSNTFVAPGAYSLGLGVLTAVEDGKAANQIRFQGNLIQSEIVMNLGHVPGEGTEVDEAAAQFKRAFDWAELGNVFQKPNQYLRFTGRNESGLEVGLASELTALHQFWGQEDSGSSEGIIRFRGGDLIARFRSDDKSITPDDFRLRPDSAGYQAGPNGKDLGANIDFVGPGEAYERWKQTEDYQQWLQDARQLLQPESPQTASADSSSGSKTTAD